MICPECRTENDEAYVFCVNCGAPIGRAQERTAQFTAETVQKPVPPTVFVREAPYDTQSPGRIRDPTIDRIPPRKRTGPLLIGAALGLLILFGAIVGGGYAIYVYTRSPQVAEVGKEGKEILPDHLGFFVRSAPGQTPVEVRRVDSANSIEARDAILADPEIQKLAAQPEFILYADPAETPLSDVKLVRIDAIADDGKVKRADYQAAIVDDKPAMKRIMLPQPLPSGKYAFALFSGYFNEGRHKFWPFEIPAGDEQGLKFEQELALDVKPTQAPAKPDVTKPESVPIPAGATIAYCKNRDVWLRRSPALEDKGKIALLRLRQKVYVMRYSENTSVWNGITSNWAFVQTEAGKQGWVFNALLDHG